MGDGEVGNVGDARIGVVRYLNGAGAAVAELVTGEDTDDAPESAGADDTGVAGYRISGGATALLTTERVEAGAHRDIAPLDRALVRHRQRHTALARGAQVTEPREDLHRTDLDGLAGGYRHGLWNRARAGRKTD